MRNGPIALPLAVLLFGASACTPPDSGQPAAAAASAPTAAIDPTDLTGVWTNSPPESTRAFQNWSFSAEPPQLTAWGRERYDQAKPTFGDRSVPVTDTNDPVYDCFPPGTPRVYFHPFPMEITHTPGRVLMLFEYDHLIRQIYVDGREHRTDLAPMWMGDSIGRWEGDTLVVETVNFNDQTWLDRRGVPHSDQLRVTERIRRIDADNLQIDITIEDPIALTEPWIGQRFYSRTDWQIEELVCMDNVNFAEYEEDLLQYDGE
jgi:hypothetical protein